MKKRIIATIFLIMAIIMGIAIIISLLNSIRNNFNKSTLRYEMHIDSDKQFIIDTKTKKKYYIYQYFDDNKNIYLAIDEEHMDIRLYHSSLDKTTSPFNHIVYSEDYGFLAINGDKYVIYDHDLEPRNIQLSKNSTFSYSGSEEILITINMQDNNYFNYIENKYIGEKTILIRKSVCVGGKVVVYVLENGKADMLLIEPKMTLEGEKLCY